MSTDQHELTIVRDLAKRKREIGMLPRQQETVRMWTALNDLKPVRPLVWMNEIPWDELVAADPAALAPRCQDPFLRGIEARLRREMYQWDHFAGDMVVEPFMTCSLACGPSGVYADYGLKPDEIKVEGTHDVLFRTVIRTMDDVQKIQRPKVWVDRDGTEKRRQRLEEALGGVLPVVVQGIVHQWHTPWDMAVRWFGVEQLLYDLVDNPELVAAVCERMCTIASEVLDDQERLGLLDVASGNYRVGSGGLGYASQLPSTRGGQPVTPRDQWGCGNAQVFSEVSPAMHEEFSLRFERPFMERFGLSYYGCCEPLHHKLDLMRRIRNLRKISMSPKADLRVAAEAIRRDYVISFKPNPAQVATDRFDSAMVRRYMADALSAMRGCNVEIIFKDITTARSDAKRLGEWTKLALEAAESAAG